MRRTSRIERPFVLMADSKGYERPNHTQTPNTFFDESLKNIKSMPELKVVLAIIRKTLGWQKTRDKISMSQIRELTGMGQQSVQRGIDLALKDGLIDREESGQQFFYSLKLVTPCDQSHHVTSHTTGLEPVTRRDRKPVTPCDTQKKGKEKKEISGFALLMDFHSKRIGKIPDGKAQGGAAKWILESGFSPEQAIGCYEFLLTEKWLNGLVSWLTVKSKVGAWVATQKQNGHAPKVDRAEREAAMAREMGWDKFEQRT